LVSEEAPPARSFKSSGDSKDSRTESSTSFNLFAERQQEDAKGEQKKEH
jgi:hypothetical protein